VLVESGVIGELQTAIAECLSLHAQAMDKLGTDRPELDPRIDETLREKLIRQRANVVSSLDDQADLHLRQVESLNKGLRIILRRLAPSKPKPPAPPMPTWDDEAKAWRIPVPRGDSLEEPPLVAHGKDRIAELARQFDQRTPDDPNELFREGDSS
jgi:hypothetical protein